MAARTSLVPVWVGIAVVAAALVAVAAGVLSWLKNRDTPAAVLTGGAAFGAALTLGLLLVNTLA